MRGRDSMVLLPSTLSPEIQEILAREHRTSPIKLGPVSVGQKYIVRIKCVNEQAVSYSEVHEPVVLRAAPPIPVFTKKEALDGAVCLRYEMKGYQPAKGRGVKYEI